MKIDTLYPKPYVTAADLKNQSPVTLTIRGLAVEDVGDGEQKPVLYFNEAKKGLVLNVTNAKIIAQTLGDDEVDTWTGKKITLVVSPVPFQGKLVDAIRVTAPMQAASPAPSTGLDTEAGF